MKKLKLSGFDLGVIIAFVLVTLLGGGGWWYLSSALQDAQAEVAAAKADFDKYSKKSNVVVSPPNEKALEVNIDLLKSHLDPLIEARLLPKENKLRTIEKEDPVEWKHDLDDDVHRLNTAAKAHVVTVPPNFYFGFSRYLNQSPSDEQTAVLKKQLVGVEQLATILINAPVKGIQAIRRTYEEDPHTGGGASPGMTPEGDHLGGYALTAPGNAYTAYPFEIDFETTSENLRTVIDNLVQSPYVFVVRTLSIQNTRPNSPLLNDLDKLAATPADSSVISSSPGEVAAAAPPKGPQFLFGNSTLKVKIRIDMIEWNAALSEAPPVPAPSGAGKPPVSPSGGKTPVSPGGI
jgi:hypothetical protein